MKAERIAAAVRASALLRLSLLFCAAFAATFCWIQFRSGPHAKAASVAAVFRPPATAASTHTSHSLIVPGGQPLPLAPWPAADPGAQPHGPLPAAHLATLVEAGISADDSEQRSLAILELSQAPVEQSLGGLVRILRENRDTRSRMTALEVLLHLPDSPQVREQRPRLLDLLSRDQDASLAAAARVGATAG